jgi:hypothetical protein
METIVFRSFIIVIISPVICLFTNGKYIISITSTKIIIDSIKNHSKPTKYLNPIPFKNLKGNSNIKIKAKQNVFIVIISIVRPVIKEFKVSILFKSLKL